MKKIGLIGGLGPASTMAYYKGIIDKYKEKTGKIIHPEIIIYSVDMITMTQLIDQKRWDVIINQFIDILEIFSKAGIDLAVITSNTFHQVFDTVYSNTPVPMLSIVDEACKYIKKSGLRRVLTIGTIFTMKDRLYTDSLEKIGVVSLLPSEKDQRKIHSLFFPNLQNSVIIPEDKEKIITLVNQIIKDQNADSLLLGCTELPLMIKPDDINIHLIDTMKIHIDSIISYLTT